MSKSDISDISDIETINDHKLKRRYFYELQPKYTKGQI